MRGWIFLCVMAVLVVSLSACRKSGSNNGGQAAVPAPAASGPVVAPSAPPSTVPVTPSPSRPRIVIAPISARSDELWQFAHRGVRNMAQVCVSDWAGGVKQAASVSHYYISPGARAGDYRCRNGYGYFGQPAMEGTCLHPCRSMAADPRFYRPGEVIFFPALVGLTCGSGRNKMIHDGFMVVTDNGNPEAINIEGRFALFWGRCQAEQYGFCLDDGAVAMDFALTFSNYCRAWRPQNPLRNENTKLLIYNQVRREAARRGDNQAASSFDLDAWIGIGIDANGMLFRRN